MKRYSALVLVMLMVPVWAFASSKPDTMPFATDYTSSGALTPLLTWNNGNKTFVELPGRVQVTGAFVGDTAARQFVSVQYSSPYWVIPAVARKMTIVTPLGNVMLDYQGPVPQEQLAANSKQLNDDVNTLKQESATLAAMLKKRQSLAQGPEVAAVSKRSQQEAAQSPVPGSRSRGQIRQGPMMRPGQAGQQGWGRREQGPNDAVAAGSGTISQFESTVVPSRWQVQENAPITPTTKIAWDYSPNWHAALQAVAVANGWNLKCSKAERVCHLNPVWHVYAGSTLRTVLGNWSKAVNWTLQWDPSWDRDIPGNATFIGSYHHAVAHLVTILHNEGVPVRAKFWGGNETLEILSQEPAHQFGTDNQGGSNDNRND